MTDAELQRAVLADESRPCFYRVAGPCHHPTCLERHYDTLKARDIEEQLEQELT